MNYGDYSLPASLRARQGVFPARRGLAIHILIMDFSFFSGSPRHFVTRDDALLNKYEL